MTWVHWLLPFLLWVDLGLPGLSAQNSVSVSFQASKPSQGDSWTTDKWQELAFVTKLDKQSKLIRRIDKSNRGSISPLKSREILAVFFLVFLLNFCLFIFDHAEPLLLCMGFLSLRRVGAALGRGAGASHCGGVSCRGTWALGGWTSVVVARELSSCGAQA